MIGGFIGMNELHADDYLRLMRFYLPPAAGVGALTP